MDLGFFNPLALEDVQVGAAHSGSADSDDHVQGASDPGDRHFGHLEFLVVTVYVSGDNASLDVVREVAERKGPVDTAVLFAGAVRTPLFDGALLTLDGTRAAEAAAWFPPTLVPAHVDSWAHFTESREQVEAAFAAAGLADCLQ